MSHLTFAVRGHIDWSEFFIKELSTRYLPYKIYDPKEKKMVDKIFKARLCPIQLYDFVFPDDQWDAVANTILGTGKGEPMNPKHKKFIWALQKMMGLKKIPPYKTDFTMAMSPPVHQEIIGIGYKEDFWVTENGKHVAKKDKTPLSQEGL